MLKMSDKYQKIYIYQTIIIIKIKYEDSFTQNIKKHYLSVLIKCIFVYFSSLNIYS